MQVDDLLRLAGVQGTIAKKEPIQVPQTTNSNNNVKYCLMSVIEYYNSECEKCNAVNAKNVYQEMISRVDDIIGCVSRHCDDLAKEKFEALDCKIKQDICKCDGWNDCCKQYFNIAEPQQEQPVVAEPIIKVSVEEVNETVEVMTGLEMKPYTGSENEASDYPREKEKSVKIPTDVISDIKTKIKELDDGNNYHYISHLKDAEKLRTQYSSLRSALEIILDYLTDACDESIKMAAVYVSSLDSVTKHQLPLSIWKFLCVPYVSGNTIKDRMKEINNKITRGA